MRFLSAGLHPHSLAWGIKNLSPNSTLKYSEPVSSQWNKHVDLGYEKKLAYTKRQSRVFQAELCLRSAVLETGEVDEEHSYFSPHMRETV